MKKIFKRLPLLIVPMLLSSCIGRILPNIFPGNSSQSSSSSSSSTQSGSSSSSSSNSSSSSSSTSSSQSIAVTGISLNVTSFTIKVGQTYTLQATIAPSNASNKRVSWSSDNAAVTVSSGTIKGVSIGSANVVVKTEDGNKTATCAVTVVSADTVIEPSGITMSLASQSVEVNKTFTLSATVLPANADNQTVTWTTASSSIATLSKTSTTSGGSVTVTGKSVGSTTITATTSNGRKATCEVTVTEKQVAEWTIMFYVCGADLESQDYLDDPDYTESEAYEYGYNGTTLAGYASRDIDELLQVTKPSNVNIILETGGAANWAKSEIKNNELGRWHISNTKTLVKDGKVSDANMSAESTFLSFLNWGFEEYPANKYGLFMWNHGGAYEGVCFDEKKESGKYGLTADEIDNALTSARSSNSVTSKLEFIAYDACLMALQEAAEINSKHFNYMVASQESEYAGGYDYDAWLPTLYANPTSVSTKSVCEKIAETFMDEQNSDADSYNNHYGLEPGDSNYWPHDQTQAVYDLSKVSAYKDAFEDLAASLQSKNASTLKTAINKAKKYGAGSGSNSMNGGYRFDIFDVKQAMDQIATSFTDLSTKTTAVKTALDNMVVFEEHGSDTEGCGLNMFYPIAKYISKSSYLAQSNFAEWNTVVNNNW